MESQRGQSIFLSIVGVATLLVAIVGATFAYFSITVQGNENANSIAVETATVGNVVFTDGNEISVGDIYPGWSASKTFTIANTQPNATGEISYMIQLDVAENTLTAVAASQFVYSISGSSNHSGTVITLTDQVVPATLGKTTLSSAGVLKGTDTHSYTFTIKFKETGGDQNAAQGKKFRGKLFVELAPGQGKRTWDASSGGAGVGGWVAYP